MVVIYKEQNNGISRKVDGEKSSRKTVDIFDG